MRKLILVLTAIISAQFTIGQELNARVVVNASLTGQQNEQIFSTLENQLSEFINTTRWTTRKVSANERINCNFVINIKAYNNDLFNAEMQVQSSRPVYGSSFSTPVYNFNDEHFTFNYLEFQNLNFNQNQYTSNLISVISFHIYMILGLDADTFELNGGDTYYDQAQTIVNYSQQEGFIGWSLQDGLNSRFAFVDNILSPTYKEFREVLYNYHRNGLDLMSDELQTGKEAVRDAILKLEIMYDRRPNSFLNRIFFDAKANEIKQIFSGGPQVPITDLVNTLNKIAPTYSSQWSGIKF